MSCKCESVSKVYGYSTGKRVPIHLIEPKIFKTNNKVKKVLGKITAYSKKHDTVPAILQPGELVIPKRKVKQVLKVLKENGIKVPK